MDIDIDKQIEMFEELDTIHHELVGLMSKFKYDVQDVRRMNKLLCRAMRNPDEYVKDMALLTMLKINDFKSLSKLKNVSEGILNNFTKALNHSFHSYYSCEVYDNV
jgi:hypothetical protein